MGRWRRFIVRVLALGVVSCALLISLAKLALPWLAAHPEKIAAYLSQTSGTKVMIESATAEWDAQLQIRVNGLRLGEASGGLEIASARLRIDPFGFVPSRRWLRDIEILAPELSLIYVNGAWIAQGLGQRNDVNANLASQLRLLEAIGQITIRDARLNIHTPSGALLMLQKADVALRRRGDRLLAALQFPTPELATVTTPQLPARQSQIIVRASWQPSSQSAEIYLNTESAQLNVLAELFSLFQQRDVLPRRELDALSGELDLSAWISLRAGKLAGGTVQLRARDERNQSSLDFNIHSSDGQKWPGELRFTDQHVPLFAAFDEPHQHLQIHLAAHDAPLSLHALSRAIGAHAPLHLASLLSKLDPQGRLTDAHFALSWDAKNNADALASQPNWRAILNLQALEFKVVERAPGVRNLDLQLHLDAQGAHVNAQGKEFVLELPNSFRKPILVQSMALQGALWPQPEGWREGFFAELTDVQLSAPGYDATAYVRFEKWPQQTAQMTASIDVSRGDISQAGQFWVKKNMSDKAIAWLDAALIKGQTGVAKAIYRTPLARAEFPFYAAQGRFEADFELKRSRIRFSPDWPVVDVKEGEFTLLNNSISARRVHGEIGGNPVKELNGNVSNFKEPVAQFSVQGGEDFAHLLTLIRQSPIGKNFGANFVNLQGSGQSRVELDLRIPLKPGLGEQKIIGQAALEGVRLSNTDWQLELADVKGRVDFDRLGLHAKSLTAMQFGLPVKASIALGESHTEQSDLLVDGIISGPIPPKELFAQEPILAPILSTVSGQSDWLVRVKTLRDRSKLVAPTASETPPAFGPSQTTIELSSDLRGVAIDLPEPLGKRASQTRPLRLSIPTESQSARALVLDIAGNVRFLAQLGNAERDFRGVLSLGDSMVGEMPEKGLRIRGAVEQLDMGAWAPLVGGTAASGAIELADVQIQANSLGGAFAALPGAMRFNATPVPEGWEVQIDASAAKGTLKLHGLPGAQTLTAQFDHLYLPEVSGGSSIDWTLDPSVVPIVHLYVADFSIGTAKLGVTRVESFPTREGMRIDLLESKSPNLTLSGAGDWVTSSAENTSRFKLSFSSPDLGRMLAGLGFSGHVAGGQTLAQLDAHWPGSPTNFALARLSGTLDVWVGEGRFLELSPGAGRLFGLLSLRELPRRLALDFSDFFSSGMSFSEIKGSFDFQSGNAFTQNMLIKAPAADISISGRTGLSTRDYEQIAQVRPKVGMLPLVGALAGGPAGAAAGLLAQGVLEGEKTLAAEYTIRGTWEAPEVVKLASVRDPKKVPR